MCDERKRAAMPAHAPNIYTFLAYYRPPFGLAAAILRQGGARDLLDNSELKKFAVGFKGLNVKLLDIHESGIAEILLIAVFKRI